MADSHANFVYFDVGGEVDRFVAGMTGQGVLVRPMGSGWVRVTIGDDEENRRFLAAFDAVR